MLVIIDLTKPMPITQDYMGTDVTDEDDYSSFATRLGNCYELAARAVVDGDLGDGILVHGSVHGRGSYKGKPHQRIGHAWVVLNTEPGEPRQVWEPITGEVYLKRDWYLYARAQEERLYDETTARINLLRHATYGRWHDSQYP